MGEEVKLLGSWPSAYSRRIELALKLKGIKYQYIEEDLSNKSHLLLKSNPVHKKIPVLIHNGKSVAESLVILEYIDETWKNNPILPENPYDRAMVRFWANFLDGKIAQMGLKTSMAKEEELEQVKEEFYQNLKLVEKELEGKKFFGGESIGYLDIVAFTVVYWFQVLYHEVMKIEFITEEKFPVFDKWLGKLLKIDAVKDSLPPRDQQIAYGKSQFRAASK